MIYSSNTTPLREKVERHEGITLEEYSVAVRKFSDNLVFLYGIISGALNPEVRGLLARIVKESDDLTAITCILPEGDLREQTIRVYNQVTQNDPSKPDLFDYNDMMKLACGLTMFLRRSETENADPAGINVQAGQ